MTDSPIVRPAEKIVGELITLEKNVATFKEAERRFALIDANREHLLPWMAWFANIKTPEDTYDYLKSCEDRWAKGSGFAYGIIENATDMFVGGCVLMDVSFENKTALRGSWLAKSARGKGYAQEAGVLMEAQCDKMGIQRISTFVETGNIASIRNMEKSGYTLEGTLRNDKWCDIRKTFCDMRIYAKVKER